MTESRAAVLRGIGWMAVTAFCFAVVLASVRSLSASLPTFEILFFRNVISLMIVVPMLARTGIATVRTRRLPLHALRALLTAAAMLAAFYALAHMPLADAASLQFLIPLFTMLGSALVLREVIGGLRWVATTFGFFGALIVIRPGFSDFNLAALIMALSSAGYAAEWIAVKFLTRTESATAIVFYMNVLMLPVTVIPALFVWVPPSIGDVPGIAALGTAGWLAIFCQARALASADASVVMPFDFLRLPFSAFLAFILFDEIADLWTWIGAAIIFASVYVIVRHETGPAR